MQKSLLIIVLSVICSPLLWAQQNLQGRVVDAASLQPLSAAHIRIAQTSTVVTTNPEGEFLIQNLNNKELKLEITYTGYHSQIIEVQNIQDYLRVSLVADMTILNPVIITATRSKRGIYDVPMRIDLLDAKSIESMPALSADDYLRSIAGISVSRGASFLGSSTVSMRGMGSEAGRTLVMVDGIPVNKSDGGSVNWNAINAEDIAQIEVVKGPGSSIHGGNAMGGVINLITLVPTQKVEGYLSQSYGTFETANTQARFSGRNGKFFWSLNGRYRKSDGYLTTPADEITDYSVASFLDEYQLGIRGGYFFQPEHYLDISATYYQGKRGTGSKFTGFGFTNEELAADDGAYNQFNGKNARILYRGSIKDHTHINISLFGQRENYQNIRESLRNNVITRYDVESIRDDMGWLSSLNTRWGQWHNLTSGIDFRHSAVDGADVYLTSTDRILNLGKMNQLGIYLQDEIQIGQSPWSLLAGLRFDHAKFYDGAFLIENPTNQSSFLKNFAGTIEDASFQAFSPRISLQYFKAGQFRLYGGYSRGFRAPVLDDMCRTGLISGGMKLANPALLPEYLENYEIGGDWFLGKRLTVSPALFYSLGTDYHAYIATGDSLIMNNRPRPIRVKDNIGKVAIQGAEIAAQLQIISGLSWNTSYSYTQTEIKEYKVLNAEKDENLVGKELVYQPRDLFSTSLSWRNPYLNAFVSYQSKSAQWLNDINTEKIESFSYIDLHLWRPVYKGLSIALKVHNLFDQDYIDSRHMIAPGRMTNVELRYHL